MSEFNADWRCEIADQVIEWVRDERTMARFRERCDEFREEQKRDQQRLADWERQRKDHCIRGIRTLSNLKARARKTERLGKDHKAIERTRPKEDADSKLVWDYFVLSPHLLGRLGARSDDLVGFGVWTPPELCSSRVPKLTVPNLFGRFFSSLGMHSSVFGTSVVRGEASWAEKYANLAAMHDALNPDRPAIDEKRCTIPPDPSFAEFLRHGEIEAKRDARKLLQRDVMELPDSSERIIRAWLADVQTDLAKNVKLLTRASNEQQGNEYTLSEASEKHDIPKPAWTKAAKLKPGEYGYLPTRAVGRNRFVTTTDAEKFAKDYEARREQRTVGSKSADPDARNVVASFQKLKKNAPRRRGIN